MIKEKFKINLKNIKCKIKDQKKIKVKPSIG
jgi:hypothetical protein